MAAVKVATRYGVHRTAKVLGLDYCRLKTRVEEDPFGGWVFVFRNRKATAVKLLIYDGQGFWLCHKRLSSGRFPWWPSGRNSGEVAQTLSAHQLQVLLSAGDPTTTQAAAAWRPVGPTKCI